MPAIKAYKHGDDVIPVDQAKVVKAYQCPWTGRVVLTKKTYLKHLRELRENRMHARIRQARIARMMKELNDQPDWQSMIDWVERNSHWFLARAKRSAGSFYDKEWPEPEDFWMRITYLDIRHSDSVSNSHNCPRGGVTNWGRREPGRPTGYPGWHGRIEYELSHYLPGVGSDLMRGTGIHTGSGGGSGSNRFGYSVELFDADWPVIAAPIEQERVLAILKDGHYAEPSFRYGTPRYFR